MGKKNLTNAHCLLELIEKAAAPILKDFSKLPECQALSRGFDWSQNDALLPDALLEHVKHLRKDQRDPAEREALRVLRLASPRGAAFLATVALQLNDSDLNNIFFTQSGGEIGRSVWMRTYSDDSARLFDVAESMMNTGDLHGNKRLHDAFDVPCDDAPPFIWNDAIKKGLETQLTTAMLLYIGDKIHMHRHIEKLRNSKTAATLGSIWKGTMPLRKLLLISGIAFVVYFCIDRITLTLLDKNLHEFKLYFRYVDLPASVCFLFVYLGLWRALKKYKGPRIRRMAAKTLAFIFMMFCVLNILFYHHYLGVNENINICKIISAKNKPTAEHPFSGYWINYCGESETDAGDLIQPSKAPNLYLLNSCDIVGKGGGWSNLKIPGDSRYYIKVINSNKIAIKSFGIWTTEIRSNSCPVKK